MAKTATAARLRQVREPVPVDQPYLTPDQAHALIETAGKVGRQRFRDRVLLRLLYRHGLRVSEGTGLRWDDLRLDECAIHIRRKKLGKNSTHTMDRDEIGDLRRLNKERESPYVFVSERGGPMDSRTVQNLVQRAGKLAGLGDRIHPHMLRHGCGYALVNQGIDQRLGMEYLGHKTAAMFQHYSEVAPERLRDVRVR